MHRRVRLYALALLVAACRSGGGGSASPGTAGEASAVPSSPTAGGAAARAKLVRCEDIERISAPAERYRDRPIYVANEQPIEEIRAWAVEQPGYAGIWIDREHLGWITVAYSTDADARQADLERLFPDVGVVAVEVERSAAELEALLRRVYDELRKMFEGVGAGADIRRGVVRIAVGVLTDERLAAIEERFGDEPICVEGIDPSDAPAPGPQRAQGEGWRLLVDEPGRGRPYRTGIAFDTASYRQLWAEIGLAGERPAVDFETELAIWFGAVYGSSCPDLRLDDVVIDRDRALVHAEIVLVDPPPVCTSDANPRAYVVALERARLPAGPFAIQLGADDPPRGVPEERTLVGVDLSPAGAVAAPGEVHGDPSLPEPFVLESGAIVEPGRPASYRLRVHCGIEWLGKVNSVDWRAEVPDGVVDFVPPEWAPVVAGDSIVVSILLQSDAEPTIEATANGYTVVYHATAEEPTACG